MEFFTWEGWEDSHNKSDQFFFCANRVVGKDLSHANIKVVKETIQDLITKQLKT